MMLVGVVIVIVTIVIIVCVILIVISLCEIGKEIRTIQTSNREPSQMNIYNPDWSEFEGDDNRDNDNIIFNYNPFNGPTDEGKAGSDELDINDIDY